jgi:hypothetical protein
MKRVYPNARRQITGVCALDVPPPAPSPPPIPRRRRSQTPKDRSQLKRRGGARLMEIHIARLLAPGDALTVRGARPISSLVWATAGGTAKVAMRRVHSPTADNAGACMHAVS